MNGLKALITTAVALSLAGCGQAYNPGAQEHTAAPQDKGDVFGSNPDAAPYQTVSYDALRSILIDFLGMPIDNPEPLGPGAESTCGTVAATCPVTEPVAYLDANRGAMGVAVFTADPLGTQAPSLMTSGGFKIWIVASSSACGLAMRDGGFNGQNKRADLFPNGAADPNYFFQALLARNPSAAELTEIDILQASFTGDEAKMAAAVCTVGLTSLENLSAN